MSHIFNEDALRDLVREVVLEVVGGTEDDPLLGRKEAAEYLGVSEQHISNLTWRDKLKRDGAKNTAFRIRRSTLDRYLAGGRS